jgi:hypothetical protein
MKEYGCCPKFKRGDNTSLKTIRTTLVSIIFRQYGRCFGIFDIAE